MQYPFMMRRSIMISNARRARAASSRLSPPSGRQPAQWRLRVCHAKTGCALIEATARTSYHSLALRVRGLPPVHFFIWCVVWSRPARHGAHARLGCVFCHQFERQPAQWRLFACHVNAPRVEGHSSLVALQTCAERERPSASAVPFNGVRTDHNQRDTARASGKLTCFAISQGTPSAVALVRVPRKCRLRVGGHGSQVALRSGAERERPFVSAVPSYSVQIGRNQRGTARACGKLARFSTSRSVALVRVPRECRLRVGDHSSHVAPRSWTGGERPPAGAVPCHIP